MKRFDLFDKLSNTSAVNLPLELDGTQECAPKINGRSYNGLPITEVTKAGGKKMKVLKSMLTTACERNCNYCPFRAGRTKIKRATIKPEELAKTFMEVHRGGAVEGMFLSTGIIKGSVTTQDRIIKTAELIRNTHGYRGYMHVKLMPGLEKDQLRRTMQLADRVSVNLEAPTPQHLSLLAPKKHFLEELYTPLKWAKEIRGENPRGTWNGRWASAITQFVVGAIGERDVDLVSLSERLYHDLAVKRVYYSMFRPVIDTPLEHLPPEDDRRGVRLYQTSFLLRDYGFEMEELPFDQSGNLPRDIDPKLAIARETLLHAPIEINRATREELLRVPGLGVLGVSRILTERRLRTINNLSQLHKLCVRANQAKDFVLLDGKRPARQMSLF